MTKVNENKATQIYSNVSYPLFHTKIKLFYSFSTLNGLSSGTIPLSAITQSSFGVDPSTSVSSIFLTTSQDLKETKLVQDLLIMSLLQFNCLTQLLQSQPQFGSSFNKQEIHTPLRKTLLLPCSWFPYKVTCHIKQLSVCIINNIPFPRQFCQTRHASHPTKMF